MSMPGSWHFSQCSRLFKELRFLLLVYHCMEHRIKLRVLRKIQETKDAATLLLQCDTPISYQAGQFLTFLFDHLEAKPIRRAYSLSSTPGLEEHLAITVKKVSNGSASRYLVDKVQEGAILEALLPAGQFVLPPSSGKPRDIFLIGGGSGITPLFSILKYVLYFEKESRVILLNANSNENSIIFRSQLRHLSKRFPARFNCIHFLSDTISPLSELQQIELPLLIRRERISNALIQQLVSANLTFRAEDAVFFLCGPKSLMLKVSQTLPYLGFGEKQIHQEIFDIVKPYRPPRDLYGDSQVRLNFQGAILEFPLTAGQTILEAAESAGLDLPYSCRSGICTTCLAKCTAGKVEMFTAQGQITTAQSDGIVFTCVGYPLTDEVALEIKKSNPKATSKRLV